MRVKSIEYKGWNVELGESDSGYSVDVYRNGKLDGDIDEYYCVDMYHYDNYPDASNKWDSEVDGLINWYDYDKE